MLRTQAKRRNQDNQEGLKDDLISKILQPDGANGQGVVRG